MPCTISEITSLPSPASSSSVFSWEPEYQARHSHPEECVAVLEKIPLDDLRAILKDHGVSGPSDNDTQQLFWDDKCSIVWQAMTLLYDQYYSDSDCKQCGYGPLILPAFDDRSPASWCNNPFAAECPRPGCDEYPFISDFIPMPAAGYRQFDLIYAQCQSCYHDTVSLPCIPFYKRGLHMVLSMCF